MKKTSRSQFDVPKTVDAAKFRRFAWAHATSLVMKMFAHDSDPVWISSLGAQASPTTLARPELDSSRGEVLPTDYKDTVVGFKARLTGK